MLCCFPCLLSNELKTEPVVNSKLFAMNMVLGQVDQMCSNSAQDK